MILSPFECKYHQNVLIKIWECCGNFFSIREASVLITFHIYVVKFPHVLFYCQPNYKFHLCHVRILILSIVDPSCLTLRKLTHHSYFPFDSSWRRLSYLSVFWFVYLFLFSTYLFIYWQ